MKKMKNFQIVVLVVMTAVFTVFGLCAAEIDRSELDTYALIKAEAYFRLEQGRAIAVVDLYRPSPRNENGHPDIAKKLVKFMKKDNSLFANTEQLENILMSPAPPWSQETIGDFTPYLSIESCNVYKRQYYCQYGYCVKFSFPANRSLVLVAFLHGLGIPSYGNSVYLHFNIDVWPNGQKKESTSVLTRDSSISNIVLTRGISISNKLETVDDFHRRFCRR